MACPEIHEIDIRNILSGTTSKKNLELLQAVVYLISDGQYNQKGKNALAYILSHGQKYGVTVANLYQDFLNVGVDPAEIFQPMYNNNKKEFLFYWLLTPSGGNHQRYTHKGWCYDYSSDFEGATNSDWTAQAINQSWLVKKNLLISSVKSIYNIQNAGNVSGSLYNIHRLRDVQNNGGVKHRPKAYYKNIPYELETYTLPLFCDIKDQQLFSKEINVLTENIDNYYEDYYEKGYNLDGCMSPMAVQIDRLIGSKEGSDGGILEKLFKSL